MPPSPTSITREEPGGDAFDPHQAALGRLLSEPWGWRADKREVFHFPLTDSTNWRRVRFFGVPTFVGFRYGDRHRAIAAMRLTAARPDDPATPAACMQRFFDWAEPIADGQSTHVTAEREVRASWRSRDDVLLRMLEAKTKTLLSHKHYLAVVGTMLPWPGVCAAYGYAFAVDNADDLARRTRDLYAAGAYSQLVMLADKPPPTFELR